MHKKKRKAKKKFILYFPFFGHCLGSRASALEQLIVALEDKYLNDRCSPHSLSAFITFIIIMPYNVQYHFGHLSWLCPLPTFCPLCASWLGGERCWGDHCDAGGTVLSISQNTCVLSTPF